METIQQWDFNVLTAIQQLRTPFLDLMMPFVSSLGDNGVLWILIAVALLWIKPYRRGGITVLAALLTEVLLCNGVLKNIFQRPRPCDIAPLAVSLIARPSGYSFPSNHTASSFAVATVLYAINKKWGLLAYFIAALIGFTRLYLYVHFPTDVLGGVFFGILIGWITTTALSRVTIWKF